MGKFEKFGQADFYRPASNVDSPVAIVFGIIFWIVVAVILFAIIF